MQKRESIEAKRAMGIKKMLERHYFLQSEAHKKALAASGYQIQKVRREIVSKQDVL